MKKTHLVFMSAAIFLLFVKFDSTFFLPTIMQGYCFDKLVYNEDLLWNLRDIAVGELRDRCASKHGLGITVAIVDSGVDLEHPDLVSNIVSGISFVAGSNDVNDGYGHGTHLAGIIAASANNAGIVGVAPEAKLMPVKVIDDSGGGSAADVAKGIKWAADQQADIINLSIGSPVSSRVVQEAVTYAHNTGALLIAAAGNCGGADYQMKGCSQQHQLDYPGVYARVIAVSATNHARTISDFSSHGAHIELAAPGEEIYSTYIEKAYETLSGTSFAVAHVAGAAAILLSANADLSNEELRAILQETAVDLGESGLDEMFGYGLINTHAALNQTITSRRPNSTVPPVGFELANEWHDQYISQHTLEQITPFVPGEILVKGKTNRLSTRDLERLLSCPYGEVQKPYFTKNADLEQRIDVHVRDVHVCDARAHVEQLAGFSDVYKITVPPGREEVYLQTVLGFAGIEYAELNYMYRVR